MEDIAVNARVFPILETERYIIVLETPKDTYFLRERFDAIRKSMNRWWESGEKFLVVARTPDNSEIKLMRIETDEPVEPS